MKRGNDVFLNVKMALLKDQNKSDKKCVQEH